MSYKSKPGVFSTSQNPSSLHVRQRDVSSRLTQACVVFRHKAKNSKAEADAWLDGFEGKKLPFVASEALAYLLAKQGAYTASVIRVNC